MEKGIGNFEPLYEENGNFLRDFFFSPNHVQQGNWNGLVGFDKKNSFYFTFSAFSR